MLVGLLLRPQDGVGHNFMVKPYDSGGGGLDSQIQTGAPTHGGSYDTDDVEAYDPDLHGE